MAGKTVIIVSNTGKRYFDKYITKLPIILIKYKNTSFLMDRNGNWSLSPAYDLTFSYKPGGKFTGTHHLSLNNKLDGFVLEDLIAFAKKLDISQSKAKRIIDEVQTSVRQWMDFAEKGNVPKDLANYIKSQHLLFSEKQ